MTVANPNRAALARVAGVVRSLAQETAVLPGAGKSASPPPWRNDAFLTVAEAASTLHMNRAVLLRWIQRGRVRAFRLNGYRWRVRLCDLLIEVPPAGKGEQHHAR